MIPLFDLHCDTLLELYNKNYSFFTSPLHVSLEKVQQFEPYFQICAIWSDCRFDDDEAFLNYRKCLKYAKDQGITFNKSTSYVSSPSFILSVEDARILNSDISRLNTLFSDGVKVITLNWKGVSCIGGGWDTSVPLTDFGLNVVLNCAKLGIVIDLSHSSFEVQQQVIKLGNLFELSPIFTHANSYSICNHRRNIKDEIAKEISARNGLIGISLCSHHLESSANATIYSLLRHINYFLELGCKNCLALGCDFDGVSALPIGINGIDDLSKLYGILINEFGKEIAESIFYRNSYNYFYKLFGRR